MTHCYHILRVLWGQEHILQTWKEKWAVLLAKTTDTADINNLRPIGLEDCMRKLWFSISYKQIADAWYRHGALDEAHHGFVPNRGTDSGFLDLLNQMEKAQEWGGVSALICSWDVKRAFDSVSRTAIRMALNRLGMYAHRPRNTYMTRREWRGCASWRHNSRESSYIRRGEYPKGNREFADMALSI